MSPRPLDDETVLAKLALIRERLGVLESFGHVDGDRLRRDLPLRLAIERAITHVVELAAAINTHVASVELDQSPHDYRRSFDAAARAGLITEQLARAIGPSAGLRNVVVHEYLEVDLDVLASALPLAVRQYGDYTRQVARWLRSRRDEPGPGPAGSP